MDKRKRGRQLGSVQQSHKQIMRAERDAGSPLPCDSCLHVSTCELGAGCLEFNAWCERGHSRGRFDKLPSIHHFI